MKPPRFRRGGWINERWRHRAAQVTRADDLREAMSPELAAALTEALDASERGETVCLGSFAQYADDGPQDGPGVHAGS